MAQIGNDNARKGKVVRSVIAKRLEERAALTVIVDKLIDSAMEGDKVSTSMIFDRMDGKPQVSMDIEANVTSHEAALEQLDK